MPPPPDGHRVYGSPQRRYRESGSPSSYGPHDALGRSYGPRPEPEPEPDGGNSDPIPEGQAGTMAVAAGQPASPIVHGEHQLHNRQLAGAAHATLPAGKTQEVEGVHGRGVRLKTYTVAVWTGKITEADRKQWWFLPSDREQWDMKYNALAAPILTQQEELNETEVELAKDLDLLDERLGKMKLNERYSPTQTHTCGPVYVQLIGERQRADGQGYDTILSNPQQLTSDNPEHHFLAGRCDEFAVTCVALDEIIGVEFFVSDEDETKDWNDRRWKVDRVAVTCVQHDDLQEGAFAPLVRKKKGEHADKSGRTGNNVQWSFVPDETDQWVGQLPPVPKKLKITRKKELRRTGADHDIASFLCCGQPRRGLNY